MNGPLDASQYERSCIYGLPAHFLEARKCAEYPYTIQRYMLLELREGPNSTILILKNLEVTYVLLEGPILSPTPYIEIRFWQWTWSWMNCWSIFYSFHGMLNNACYFKLLVLMSSKRCFTTNHSSSFCHSIQLYESPCCWVSQKQCAALKPCKRSNRLVLISSMWMFVHNFGTIMVRYKHFELTICG